jgi:4-aminobutyrate aminotransferase-like enzyme
MTGENVAMIERRHKLLGSAYKLFYDNPVHIVKGEGVWLFDADGRKYLDMYNNVPHVGHCHPQVVEALTKQIATLNTHTRYLHDNILDYAERLTAKFEEELDLAMFCCTGSEANELAMRIARTHTGGTGFIATSFPWQYARDVRDHDLGFSRGRAARPHRHCAGSRHVPRSVHRPRRR